MLRGDNTERYGWLIGTDIATLPAAVFMIRDGKMHGESIHIFEKMNSPEDDIAFIKKEKLWGETLPEYDAYETFLDLLSDIPSAVDFKRSAKEELLYFNQQIGSITSKGWKKGEQKLINQYQTTLLAIRNWLKGEGVIFLPDASVKKLGWEKYADTDELVINSLTYTQDNRQETTDIGFEDIAIVTDGYNTENSVRNFHNLVFLTSLTQENSIEEITKEVKKVTYNFLGLKD